MIIYLVHLFKSGATRKLLKWISQEYKLLIDEIEIKFPLHSSQQVHIKSVVLCYIRLLLLTTN